MRSAGELASGERVQVAGRAGRAGKRQLVQHLQRALVLVERVNVEAGRSGVQGSIGQVHRCTDADTEPFGDAVMTVPASAAVVVGQVQSMLNVAPASGAPDSSVLWIRRMRPSSSRTVATTDGTTLLAAGAAGSST